MWQNGFVYLLFYLNMKSPKPNTYIWYRYNRGIGKIVYKKGLFSDRTAESTCCIFILKLLFSSPEPKAHG